MFSFYKIVEALEMIEEYGGMTDPVKLAKAMKNPEFASKYKLTTGNLATAGIMKSSLKKQPRGWVPGQGATRAQVKDIARSTGEKRRELQRMYGKK